jgi:hypothetical protein
MKSIGTGRLLVLSRGRSDNCSLNYGKLSACFIPIVKKVWERNSV